MSELHGRIDVLGGAVALGEATWGEIEEYRAHLARCFSCVEEGSGELELARMRAVIERVREAETWHPDLSTRVSLRMRSDRRRAARLAAGALGTLAMLPFLISGAIGSIEFVGRFAGSASAPPFARFQSGEPISITLRSPRGVRLADGFPEERDHFLLLGHDTELFETP